MSSNDSNVDQMVTGPTDARSNGAVSIDKVLAGKTSPTNPLGDDFGEISRSDYTAYLAARSNEAQNLSNYGQMQGDVFNVNRSKPGGEDAYNKFLNFKKTNDAEAAAYQQYADESKKVPGRSATQVAPQNSTVLTASPSRTVLG